MSRPKVKRRKKPEETGPKFRVVASHYEFKKGQWFKVVVEYPPRGTTDYTHPQAAVVLEIFRNYWICRGSLDDTEPYVVLVTEDGTLARVHLSTTEYRIATLP